MKKVLLIALFVSRAALGAACCLGGSVKSFISLQRLQTYEVGFSTSVRDVYGGLAEITVLESYLLRPKTKPSDTVLVFMHPIGGGAYLPMINGLARAGHHVEMQARVGQPGMMLFLHLGVAADAGRARSGVAHHRLDLVGTVAARAERGGCREAGTARPAQGAPRTRRTTARSARSWACRVGYPGR